MPAFDHPGKGMFRDLRDALRSGEITRREFMQRTLELGIAGPVALFVANAVGASHARAQATPEPPGTGPNASATIRPPAPEDQIRGAGGEIKLLQWQAPGTLSAHNGQGPRDLLAASLVSEPLMSFLPDGTLWPTLVKEVPSIENGGLSPDLKTITYHLRQEVVWSDGEPFTSADVVATYNWIMDPLNGATSLPVYLPIATVEATDTYTVTITLNAGTLAWYGPFTGTYNGAVYPKHILDLGENGNQIMRTAPIGTGPYKVDSFFENDQVVYSVNERYREPNRPSFSSVNLKGGGDAASAARAVLETGDWDVAWNLQVEPALITSMLSHGKGQHIVLPGTGVERIDLNFSDPNKEVDGQRSQKDTPHPFLTDRAVRQALTLAVDRDTIASELYWGPPGEPGAANILVGIPALESPSTSYEFNIDKANQLLDASGWIRDGDVRQKNGIELDMVYGTSVNTVRIKTQAVVKEGWEAIGVRVDLSQVDAAVFFDASPGNTQGLGHFYGDAMMYTTPIVSPFPLSYMSLYYAGPDGENISQRENDWLGNNNCRYANPEYDAIFESLASETDPERAANSFIRLNDILIEDFATIPLVQRAAESFAIANRLDAGAIAASSWEVLYWNIANWHEVTG